MLHLNSLQLLSFLEILWIWFEFSSSDFYSARLNNVCSHFQALLTSGNPPSLFSCPQQQLTDVRKERDSLLFNDFRGGRCFSNGFFELNVDWYINCSLTKKLLEKGKSLLDFSDSSISCRLCNHYVEGPLSSRETREWKLDKKSFQNDKNLLNKTFLASFLPCPQTACLWIFIIILLVLIFNSWAPSWWLHVLDIVFLLASFLYQSVIHSVLAWLASLVSLLCRVSCRRSGEGRWIWTAE